MRVKKQIALLLSGAILTGSLAGCSRTIIEHQFHTDTVTEYIEKESISNLEIDSLRQLFSEHDINMTLTIEGLVEGTEQNFSDFIEPNINKTVTAQDEIEDFLDNSDDGKMLVAVRECTENVDVWLRACAEISNQFYNALVVPSDDWTWEKMKDTLKEGATLYIEYRSWNNQIYAVGTLMPSEG